jgi:hypothetical protein
MEINELIKSVQYKIDTQSLLHHVLRQVDHTPDYPITFNGYVSSYEGADADQEYFLECVETMMVAPERRFFQGRCTATIDELLAVSEGEPGTALISNVVFNTLIDDQRIPNLVPTEKYSMLITGVLGTLGNLKLVTDMYRVPEHRVLGMDDIFIVLDKDKLEYSYTEVEAGEGRRISRVVSMSAPW